eukprot:9270408-Pyramimonas_sp.AAC.1
MTRYSDAGHFVPGLLSPLLGRVKYVSYISVADLHFLIWGLFFLHPSVVDHASQVQHSQCLARGMAASEIPADSLKVSVVIMITSLRWPMVEQL